MVKRIALLAMLSFAMRAFAKNELVVDARSVQTNDTVTITVSIEGPFAAITEPHVPLRNLRFLGEPSVSSEFAFISGEVSRRKSFRFLARPIAPGPAQVGPVVLTTDDGQRDTLAGVALTVLADRVSLSNDAEVVYGELLAQKRAPMFVIAETETKSAYVGEPIAVTWYLYNATAIQEWQVVSVPKLAEFWVEELGRGEQAERVYVGEAMMQRLPIRRAMLFPLRSGAIRVEGMSVSASILQRTRGGPFSMFEGSIVETTFTSAAFDVDIKPLPPGAPVDGVGNLALRCDPAQQRNAGPVVLRVALEGVGNLRSVSAPRFERDVAGVVQVENGAVNVNRDDTNVTMSRRWQFLIFPSNAGPLEIPALSMRIFDPKSGERRELRCASSFLDVIAAKPPMKENAPTMAPTVETAAKQRWPWIVGALAALAAIVFGATRLRETLALRRDVDAVLRDATAEEIRARVAERVKIDPRESSDRGDALRALLSLLDAKERERDIAVDFEREIRQRVRDVLRARR